MNLSWLFDNLTIFTDPVFDVSISAILKSKIIELIFPFFLELGCHMAGELQVIRLYRDQGLKWGCSKVT